MNIIFLGAPGAGKGTMAGILKEAKKIPQISTGDIFRANIRENTELGKKAKSYIDKGQLVPDEVVIDIVKDRLSKDDCKGGYILDGFPRTVPQAEALDAALSELKMPLDAVVNLQVDEEELVRRLSGRWICSKCAEPYHSESKKSSKEGICDLCSGELVQRDDDRPEAVRNRLRVYAEKTAPVLDYYAGCGVLKNIQAVGSVPEIFKRIVDALGIAEPVAND
jgi:adenylate kinase